jgi:type IV secretion system protein VirB10
MTAHACCRQSGLLILLDGRSTQIGNLPATDRAGYAGLADKDFHTNPESRGPLGSRSASAPSFCWAATKAISCAPSAGSTQQSANQAGQQIVSKNPNIQPTITDRLAGSGCLNRRCEGQFWA